VVDIFPQQIAAVVQKVSSSSPFFTSPHPLANYLSSCPSPFTEGEIVLFPQVSELNLCNSFFLSATTTTNNNNYKQQGSEKELQAATPKMQIENTAGEEGKKEKKKEKESKKDKEERQREEKLRAEEQEKVKEKEKEKDKEKEKEKKSRAQPLAPPQQETENGTGLRRNHSFASKSDLISGKRGLPKLLSRKKNLLKELEMNDSMRIQSVVETMVGDVHAVVKIGKMTERWRAMRRWVLTVLQ